MQTSQFPPDALCFPTPPGRIDRTLAAAPLLPPVAAAYLEAVGRWRDAVARAIDTDDPAIAGIEHLTPRARERLALLLQPAWDGRFRHGSAASAYGLAPFPERTGADGGDPMAAVLEVLHWRAAVVDYLTDVWDVLGSPELEMGECMAIGMFMRPTRLEGRCVYCLTEFGVDKIDPEDHGCLMARQAGAM